MNHDTRAFLECFPGRHTYQTFDDKKADRTLARVTHDTTDLQALNDRGAGIYLMINEGDGQARRNENVQRIRAVFADFDGAPLPNTWGLEPNLIIESSPGKYQVYWLVQGDAPLDEFTSVQEAIAEQHGSDPRVKDLARVMRVPGYHHHKREPFLTRITHQDDPHHTWSDIRQAFPPAPKPEPAPVQPYRAPQQPQAGDRPTPEKILEVILRHADPNEGRNDTGFRIACQIRDNEYPQPDAERILREYQGLVETGGEHPYTLEEALTSVRQAYNRPAREPWKATKRTENSVTLLTTTETTPASDPAELRPAAFRIHQYNYGYAKDKAQDVEQLTNWVFEPALRLIWPRGETGERGTLTVNGTNKHELDIPASAWATRKDLLDIISNYDAVCFTTNNSDIAKIRQHILLTHQDLPTARGVLTYGLHPHQDEWVGVHEDHTITTHEHPPLFYGGTPVDPGSKAHRAPPPGTYEQIEAARSVLKALPRLITPQAALAMTGYALAAAFAPRITPTFGGRLPFLYIAGEREGGKTSSAQLLLELVTGSSTARVRKATGMSAYQYDIAHSSANNLLALLDEYRPGEIDEGQLRKHHDLDTKYRGSGIAAHDHAYPLNAPMILLGEGFTEDPAAFSRGVLYFVEKKDRGSLEEYARIQQTPAWPYAHHLHQLARTTPEAEHQARLDKAMQLARTATAGTGGPRLAMSLALIAYGLLVAQADTSEALYRDDVILQTLTWGIRYSLDGDKESATNLELFLEQLGSTASEHKDPASLFVPAATTDEIIIRASASVEYVRRKYGTKAAVANTRMLKQYAQAADFIDDKPTHKDIRGNTVRGIRIDLLKVPERCDTSALQYLSDRMRSER